MAYQPIVDWPERSVFGYEALVRSAEPSLPTPVDLFGAAERLERLPELGRQIRAQVARAAAEAPRNALLFVNLHPLDLNDPELFSPTSPLAAIAARVVLEITERSSMHAVNGLAAKVHQLRHLGFRLAVDDLGAGYAGLASFSRLEPAIVKLDISLVRGVDTSTRKQSVIRAMARLCKQDLDIRVVSEGVESAQERDVLAMLGCDLMQGYLFARPERGFSTPRW
jgi:EAL domain-containing protein (putative c-di-GMP-specific phosphodiesterase class I)